MKGVTLVKHLKATRKAIAAVREQLQEWGTGQNSEYPITGELRAHVLSGAAYLDEAHRQVSLAIEAILIPKG
jgi:hypothetical protein